MKKILILGGVLLAVASCKSAGYTVNGTVNAPETDSATVYIYDGTGATAAIIDSAVVADGKFTFTSVVPDTLGLYSFRSKEIKSLSGVFIPEAGVITVAYTENEPVRIGGTALNDIYQGFADAQKVMNDEYSKAYEKYAEARQKGEESADSLLEELKAAMEVRSAKFNELVRNTFEANKANVVGVTMAGIIAQNDASVAQIDSISAQLTAPYSRAHKTIENARAVRVAMENTSAGKKFVEIEGPALNGEPSKLSDFAGKGDWVVVDFWASWCGPCKAAMPHLKEIYNAYNGKGLKIVGVNVWEDDKADFEKAVETLELPWDMIYSAGRSSKENVATTTYGVRGIPTIMLIDPEGTIVIRTYNGQEVVDKVHEVLGQKK